MFIVRYRRLSPCQFAACISAALLVSNLKRNANCKLFCKILLAESSATSMLLFVILASHSLFYIRPSWDNILHKRSLFLLVNEQSVCNLRSSDRSIFKRVIDWAKKLYLLKHTHTHTNTFILLIYFINVYIFYYYYLWIIFYLYRIFVLFFSYIVLPLSFLFLSLSFIFIVFCFIFIFSLSLFIFSLS